MPPPIRPESVILDELLAAITRSGLVTDIAPISVLRQFTSGVSMTIAELYYALYTLYKSFFLTAATGEDLDIRGMDLGLPRDTGQAASGTVVFERALTYMEDIPLLAPQHVQPVVPQGETAPTYATITDAVLQPCGRSVSGEAPLTQTTAGVNDQLTLTLDGDGPQTVSLGSQPTGDAVAAAIEASVRLLLAIDPSKQPAYDRFRADWNSTTPGRFTLRSGNPGHTTSVVVTPSPQYDASAILKLGVAQGGQETPGMDSLAVPCLADVIGVASNVGAQQLTEQRSPVPGIVRIYNPLPYVDGRDVASDDAYRQAVQAHLLALGRGTTDSVLQAAATTRTPDGQQPVQSAQVVASTDANLQVFVADGRSLTLGAQPDVVQAVQDELDGRGSEPGGWLPSGVTALVRPATVRVIDVQARVLLGPAPDGVIAQRQAVQTMAQVLSHAPVGEQVTYVQMLRALDGAVDDVLRVDFVHPAVWATTPQRDLGAVIGTKLMPGHILVEILRQ